MVEEVTAIHGAAVVVIEHVSVAPVARDTPLLRVPGFLLVEIDNASVSSLVTRRMGKLRGTERSEISSRSRSTSTSVSLSTASTHLGRTCT